MSHWKQLWASGAVMLVVYSLAPVSVHADPTHPITETITENEAQGPSNQSVAANIVCAITPADPTPVYPRFYGSGTGTPGWEVGEVGTDARDAAAFQVECLSPDSPSFTVTATYGFQYRAPAGWTDIASPFDCSETSAPVGNSEVAAVTVPGSPGCEFQRTYPEGHVSLGYWHRLEVHLTVGIAGGGSGPNIDGWSLPWLVPAAAPASAAEAFTSTIEENHENGRYEFPSGDDTPSCALSPFDPSHNPPGWFGKGFATPVKPGTPPAIIVAGSTDHTAFEASCLNTTDDFTLYVDVQFQKLNMLDHSWGIASPVISCELNSQQVDEVRVANIVVPSDQCPGAYEYPFFPGVILGYHRARLTVTTSLHDPADPSIDGLTLPWQTWPY